MRNAFARCISQMAAVDDRIALLSGDIGNRLFDKFKECCPDRFLNCGIAEANMMGVAAGMALCGLRPIVYTITPFATIRCLEQIRVDVCYHNVPVIIVGTGSGFSYASLGPTHHSCEDIAILRSLPGMTVFSPCDSLELELGLEAGINLKKPLYIRLGKKGEPILHKIKPSFEFGKSLTLRQGTDCCLLSTGTITSVALESAEYLATQNISARVESFHTIKPLDKDSLEEIFKEYPIIIILEEHSQIGGLAGAISEWFMQQGGALRKIISFSIRDEFLHEIGNQDYARQKYHLTVERITSSILEAFKSLDKKKVNSDASWA